MNRFALFASVGVLATMAGVAPSSAVDLEVGEKAPNFTLKDQHGKERSLKELLKGSKVALVLHRSARW